MWKSGAIPAWIARMSMAHAHQRRRMKKFTLGLLSAAAIATTILLVRQQKEVESRDPRFVPAGETQPTDLSLQRIREAGL
jgi:hypothetical protein